VEKPKPTYDLEKFKVAATSLEAIEVTTTALRGARGLGLERAAIVQVLQSMQRADFFKSMTSYADHKVWQDVYHVPWEGVTIYIKITEGRVTEFCLLSFKEK